MVTAVRSTNGKILLVGIGPGSEEHMTLRARRAIDQADVVIGYTGYIKLIAHLIEGKEIIRKGMRQELERCQAAWEEARQGKTVALISSGDTGVYGIASPTYEVLFQSGWQPDNGIEVEIIPGCTALSACAALAGAPLGHDFCTISLSDLLTPWPVIAERLDASARSDFVIALYNPKSHHRTWQITEARSILLRYRKPATPVAIVSAAYREQQNIKITTLDKMLECIIDMSSTVLVGNSTTYLRTGLMITPRGYGMK
ncbi:MAG: precorrin-3B C17-methyltransferase [Candidatus Kentron sp. G]|nr:MAG: precorrin-3B C17-methyltransferase [Candidatus Kentron sp. G]VFM96727.1 MAG: precorrin-3B C17-methyltransferase [Candidatus Kentron sp. G]VFM98908.1 MAG: precorrin-3B C17-methyltransferase [Candidatus Kentron sp. G]